MFENLQERLEGAFKAVKGQGKLTELNVAETVKESLINSKSILEAVEESERVLSSYKKKNPSTERMATTIAVAEILDNGILVSWAGDSRVYQFRDGKIIFMTTDNSWVANAVKKGVLSSVEALFHPRVNELTKSIKDASKPVKLEPLLAHDSVCHNCTGSEYPAEPPQAPIIASNLWSYAFL